jgi:iron complex outermembrane receptor protein
VGYGEDHFYLLPEVALVAGGQVVWANRDVNDNLAPSQSASEDFAAFNPRVGIMYEPMENLQFFANVTRSYEAPDFSNLTQSGSVGFTPIAAQHAWTGEIGTRGQYGPVGWDLTLYRAWIDDEFLLTTPGSGFPASTFNGGDTIHQGVELGLNFLLGEDLLMNGDRLQWQNSYTYSDFYFEGDIVYGNNTIPGQPPHFYQTQVRYEHRDGWFIAPNVEAASSVYADYANTLKAQDFVILGLGAGYTVNEHVDLFFNARNLLDEEYVASISTIAAPTAFNTAIFYPGDDRRFFGGIRLRY